MGENATAVNQATPKPSTLYSRCRLLIHPQCAYKYARIRPLIHPHTGFPLVYLAIHTTASSCSSSQTEMGSVSRATLDQKLAMAKRCSHEGVLAGAKAAAVASVATAIPTFASVRLLPWARSNLNPTAQALIVSTVAGMAYFIVADKTVLASARKNSFNRTPKN